MRTSRSSPQLNAGADGNSSVKESTITTCKEAVVLSGYPAIEAGSPCGYLFKNFTMLHKYEIFYYVLDTKRSRLYEFRDDPEIGLEPRTIIPLHAARLEDELVGYNSSAGQLFCWKIFYKTDDGRSKILNLGASSIKCAESWIDALRPVTGTGAVGVPVRGSLNETSADLSDDIDPTGGPSDTRSMGLHMESVSDGGLREPSSAGSHLGGSSFGGPLSPARGRNWKQPIIVCGETFRIQCSDLSTNAWLLSEAIRMYMRNNEDLGNPPDLSALYNVTQDRALDLSEDVGKSITPGDIVEALASDADLIKRSSSSASRTRPPRIQATSNAASVAGGASSQSASASSASRRRRNSASSPSSGALASPKSSADKTRGSVADGRANSVPTSSKSKAPDGNSAIPKPLPVSVATTRNGNSSALQSAKKKSSSSSMNNSIGPKGAADHIHHQRMGHALSWKLNPAHIESQLSHSKGFWDDRTEQKNKILEQLDHLCVAMDSKVPFWAGPSWTPESAENGVRVFAHGESTLGVLVIPSNPTAVLERMLDARTQHEWDPIVRRVRYLEAARGSDVIHIQTSLTGPLGPRAFCISRFWMKLGDGSYVGTFTPSAHPSCPPSSGYTLGDMRCAFYLRSNGRFESLLTIHCELDIKTPFLSSWFNRRAQTTMLASLAGLREASALV
eukprot:CAMPEP_0171485950 /NCGR_PEP_ID=MMETSP0958-20121227/822_1 /TAXON_ID=87120 /ORGANISM="Aurantiochytrium limacinum, Strain ATCCMYA-1381" /LENGTH=674 /DNA_ID=CAMNT_0012018781 /DNA_START=482 /DNA_END=2507 /DNA_ORIENTATION=+